MELYLCTGSLLFNDHTYTLCLQLFSFIYWIHYDQGTIINTRDIGGQKQNKTTKKKPSIPGCIWGNK
jgi:hypothetical protein